MNAIVHVELPAADLERAMRFYASVFGAEFGAIVERHGSRMAYLPLGDGADGASVALAEGDVYLPGRGGTIVYFRVDDIDALLARALAEGSEILFPKTSIDGTWCVAEIADSEGNRIGLQSG